MACQTNQSIQDSSILEEDCFPECFENLPQEIGSILLGANQTLAVAESCTSGRVAARITSVPGSSAYFKGGVISYSTALKKKLLKVKKALLDRHTEVSGEVAKAMAMGVRQLTDADWAISTTGVAGPDRGVDGNPVGTLFIGVCGPNCVNAHAFQLRKMAREKFVERAVEQALAVLVCALRLGR